MILQHSKELFKSAYLIIKLELVEGTVEKQDKTQIKLCATHTSTTSTHTYIHWERKQREDNR